VGVAAALGCGATLPLMILLFGDVTNAMVGDDLDLSGLCEQPYFLTFESCCSGEGGRYL